MLVSKDISGGSSETASDICIIQREPKGCLNSGGRESARLWNP